MIYLKELYLRLPEALKKQIVLQSATAIFVLFLFFVVIILCRDIILALPCMLFSVFMIVKSAALLYNCIEGNYLEIKGVCSDVEVTTFRKRIKALTLKAENKVLKIPIRFRLKGTDVGDTITVYLSKKARLYYTDGSYIANDIYALIATKEA